MSSKARIFSIEDCFPLGIHQHEPCVCEGSLFGSGSSGTSGGQCCSGERIYLLKLMLKKDKTRFPHNPKVFQVQGETSGRSGLLGNASNSAISQFEGSVIDLWGRASDRDSDVIVPCHSMLVSKARLLTPLELRERWFLPNSPPIDLFLGDLETPGHGSFSCCPQMANMPPSVVPRG